MCYGSFPARFALMSALLIMLGLPWNSVAAPLDDLIEAVDKDDSTRVKALISAKVDVNGVDAKGARPLFRAALKGNPEIVRLLLDAGADPNLQHKVGWPPLFVAVARMKPETKHGEVVELLLSRGADPKKKTDDGTTLLMQAVRYNHPGMAQRLLKLGLRVRDVTKDGETVLHMLHRGAMPLMQQLIDAGADINARSKDGATPLLVSIMRNDYDAVRLLLDRGVAVDQPTLSDITPLTAACGLWAIAGPDEKIGKDEMVAIGERIVRLLVERGADVNAVAPAKPENEMGGFTPLHAASATGTAELVSYLVSKGAKIDQPIRTHKESRSYKEADGATPLMMAALGGKQELLDILLSKGAEIKARATNGYNAGMFAMAADHSKMVESLNAKGLVLTDADKKRVSYDKAVDANKQLADILTVAHEALCATVAKEPALAGAPMEQLLVKAGYKESFSQFTVVKAACGSRGCELVMRHNKQLPEFCTPVAGLRQCEGRMAGPMKKGTLQLPELVKP